MYRYFSGECKVTSDFIASSVCVNPVVVRRTLGQLKEAGFVRVEAGAGGASAAKDPADISLLDIFHAADCVDGDLFHFHENSNPRCPVGSTVHDVPDREPASVQESFEERLRQTSLKNLTDNMGYIISTSRKRPSKAKQAPDPDQAVNI